MKWPSHEMDRDKMQKYGFTGSSLPSFKTLQKGRRKVVPICSRHPKAIDSTKKWRHFHLSSSTYVFRFFKPTERWMIISSHHADVEVDGGSFLLVPFYTRRSRHISLTSSASTSGPSSISRASSAALPDQDLRPVHPHDVPRNQGLFHRDPPHVRRDQGVIHDRLLNFAPQSFSCYHRNNNDTFSD